MAKLESLALIERCEPDSERRRHATLLTAKDRTVMEAMTPAWGWLLSQALADWGEAERAPLATLSPRFADSVLDFGRIRI